MGAYGSGKYEDITSCYFNAGVISANFGDDLNAYKYWVKTAKRGGENGLQAQKFIKRICARSSWVCK